MKFSISMRGVSSSMQLRSGKVTTSAGRDVKLYNLLLLCMFVTSSTGGVTSLYVGSQVDGVMIWPLGAA